VSRGLGLSLETTEKTLTKLFEEKARIIREMQERQRTRSHEGMRPREEIMEDANLAARLEQVEHNIVEMREYYTLHLLESLRHESKNLSKLTESLICESRRLRKLTIVLIFLTALLAVFALPSFIEWFVVFFHL